MQDRFKSYRERRLLMYIGIILGAVIVIMGYLTFFVDSSQVFNKPTSALSPTIVSVKGNENLVEYDANIKSSLQRFIDAFYYDQNRGYFDPASYFANITYTYYNYHNLTFSRLLEIHHRRLLDMHYLEQAWIPLSLQYKRDKNSLIVTYGLRATYFRPSLKKQEQVDIKVELILNEEGKITSLRELERKQISSIDATDVTSLETASPNSDKLYDTNTVGTIPEFPGGHSGLNQYLKANLVYPLDAKKHGIEGKVYVRFIVEKNGSLSNLEVLNGLGSGCDEEALRLLRSSPAWKPGIFNGSFVRTAYTLPIVFQLTD